jgi:type IV pilus assembly protein PilW
MRSARQSQHLYSLRGYTLVELMVSITIGLMVLAALVTLFAGNSRQRAEVERANEQTDNGRYALQLLSEDLRDAGYLASFNPGTVTGPNPQLAIPGALPNACATDLPTLNSAIALAVQGYDNGANAPGCLADLRAGTDILVVRRASTCAVGTAGCDPQVAGDVYLQASGCTTEFSAGTFYALDTSALNLNLHQKDCVTLALLYQYRTHIYDTNVPTSGSPALYVANPNTYNGCAPALCVSYWRNTVAVQVNLLARNQTVTQGYTDTKTYTLGLTAGGAANVVGPFNDGFKRHLYSTVARLYNPAGRNSP